MASVGVAMGQAGTDVAREVADIVIADDDLRHLARAIARGRATEDNVRAALRYFLSTNLSEVLVMLGETIHGRGETETPMELFWLNLVTDVLPALGLALAEPGGDVMARGPRASDAPLLDGAETSSLLFDSLGIGGAALAAHFLSLAREGIGPQTRTATFTTLALAQVAHAWTLRDRSPAAPDALIVSRRRLEVALAAATGLLALPLTLAPLQRLLGIGPLRGGTLAGALGFAATSFGIAEARRIIASAATASAGMGPGASAAPARMPRALPPARTG
jgi:Ca2+-transporting ATPase